ncbi:hypothetical protein [Sporisorium scitamineum]|uniref:Uncharacterized protein n=1 Tax=Sporisorium scitamineum TaxID=49012 RepID=A0A0F7S1K9_9BASI|nr:hypothetical protein [Sporisorium scitamineum]
MTSIGGAAQTQSGTSEEMLVGGSSGAVDSNEHFPDMQDGQARIDQDTELQNVRTSSQQGAFILHSENPTSSSASSQVEVDVALNGPTAESECSDDAQTVRAVCAALTMVGPVADDTLPLPSGSDESRTDNLVEVDTSPLDAGSSDASMLKPTLEVLSPHSPVLDENPPLRSSDRGEASMQSYEPSELDELESDGEQDDQSPQRNRIEPDEQPAEQLQPTSPSERDELEEVEDHNGRYDEKKGRQTEEESSRERIVDESGWSKQFVYKQGAGKQAKRGSSIRQAAARSKEEAETRQQQEVETRQQEEEESQVEVVEEQVAEVRPLPEEQEAVAAGIEATDDEFDHLDDDLILQAVEDGQDEASVEAVLPSREASMLAPSAGGTMSSIAPPPSTPSAPSAPSTQSTSKASPVIPRTKEDRPSPEPNANAQPNPSSASTRNQTQHVRSSKEPESFNEAYLEFGQLTSNQKQLYIILPTTDDLLTRPVDKGYPSHPTSNEPHQKPVDKGKRRQISEEPIETSSSEEHDDDDDDGDVVRTESQHKRGSGSRPHKRVHANGSSASDSGRERGRVVVENEEDETYRELNMATINLEGENDNSDDETYIPDNDAVTMSGDEILTRSANGIVVSLEGDVAR